MFCRLVLCVPFSYQTTLMSETLNSSDDINVCSMKTAFTENKIYLQVDFSTKLLPLQWSSIEILAFAKPGKPSPFVRPKDSRFPAQRQAYFVQNTTLKFARKGRQFINVHISSDEKFLSGASLPGLSFFSHFKLFSSL